MCKAIFIDRDGVINNDTGMYYVYTPEDFNFNEGVIEFLTEIKKRGYKIIVISNQGGIAKKFYTRDDVEKLHAFMSGILKKHGVIIDEIYYCPHHSEEENCICRKPDSQMIEKGIARFDINKNKAWFVGDRESDVEAAKKAGIMHVKITANENLLNYLHLFTEPG